MMYNVSKLARKKCTGCLSCIDVCKFNALSAYCENDGHFYVKLDKKKCVKCGSCVKVCPIISRFEYRSKKNISKPFAVWAKEDDLRKNSSSGGAFAAFSKYFIEKGGYVVGAQIEGLKVRHCIIDNVSDISKVQGSKYLQSNLSGIYKEVKKLLDKKEEVLFSGTPCQVAGMISFLGENKYKNITFVDLICSGVPTHFLIQSLQKKENYEIKSVHFTNKERGWLKSKTLKIIKRDGKSFCLENNKENLVYNGFFSGLTHRFSCSDCQFAFLNRKADLTLGDFWGLKEYPEQHFLGVSLVVTHSKNGEKLLEECNVEKKYTTWDKCIPYNPRLVYGKRPFHKIHPSRIFLPFIFNKLSYQRLTMIYAGNIKKTKLFWLPYKAFNFLIYKISQYILTRYIKNTLKDL